MKLNVKKGVIVAKRRLSKTKKRTKSTKREKICLKKIDDSELTTGCDDLDKAIEGVVEENAALSEYQMNKKLSELENDSDLAEFYGEKNTENNDNSKLNRPADKAKKLVPVAESVPDVPAPTTNDLLESNSPVNGFFCTDERFVEKFEDNDITEYIQKSFPEYQFDSANDQVMRKVIIQILSNEKFTSGLLEYFDISTFDFFKYLFRMTPALFKGPFLKRVLSAIKYKPYGYDPRILRKVKQRHQSATSR